MESSAKCPYCGRNLGENEFYCYFCDMEVEAKLKKKSGSHEKSH